MKCLVVDDSALARRVLGRILSGLGFGDVVEATSGMQALELFTTTSFDLVVTCWDMPALSGLDLVRAIRSGPHVPTVPVLLISSRNTKQDVVEAVAAGVNGYLIRPYNENALREKLAEVLSGGTEVERWAS